ncbi:MAG: transporter substrate-binding domain-containing protein [Desulfobacterales bacterium]|nr:transporter substrate-binding domain-containing protein [Desulfobacterales bacterium]MBF0396418.1 transporter substrate-binding domain-containing protein [Desulfobacterales bacterium]
MKKLIFMGIIFFSTSSISIAQGIKEATINWEDGLKPPYLMLTEKKELIGIAVEMLNKILSMNQIKPIHKIAPWKRCLKEIEDKQVDLVPNSSYKDDRAKFSHYTKPLYETHLVLFYLKSKFANPPNIKIIDDFKSYKIGGVFGFNYDQYQNQINIDTGAKSREILIEKLRRGYIDIAIEQLEVVLSLYREGKVNLEGVENVPDPVMPVKVFHVLAVKNEKGKKLQEIIDYGIDKLQKDGITERIMKKYLGESYKTTK